MGKIVNSSTLLTCGFCQEASKLQEWDDESLNNGATKEMKRKYVSLKNYSVMLKGSKYMYKCPKCKRWVQAGNIKVTNPTTELLKGLGGGTEIEIVNADN